MICPVCGRGESASRDTVGFEIDRLRDCLRDDFPVEYNNIKQTSDEAVVDLTLELLDRLWRWSH